LSRQLPFERVAAAAGLAYAAFRAIKFDSLFIATTVFFISPIVAARFPRSRTVALPPPAGVRVINGIVVVVLLVAVALNSGPKLTCLPSADWRPDPTASAALIRARPSGRIAVTFDWGEYVIWHLGPQLQVSFDPRFDLIYSPRTIAEQHAVGAAEPEGVAFLERTMPEYVWFRQSDTRLKSWVSENGYRIDVDTPVSFIAVRHDIPLVTAVAPQLPGCFPAP
jgi:hypothetical protein